MMNLPDEIKKELVGLAAASADKCASFVHRVWEEGFSEGFVVGFLRGREWESGDMNKKN